jgi:thiol:disulfide interchange protein
MPQGEEAAPAATAPAGRTTRARPTVLLVLAACFFVARIATGIQEAYRPPRPGGLVRWLSPAALEAMPPAARRPILYAFSAPAGRCEPCAEMDGDLFSRPAAADFINATFIAVRVTDDDPSPAGTALRIRHQVATLPTLVVVHPDTREPRRLEGYPGRGQALGFLKLATGGR